MDIQRWTLAFIAVVKDQASVLGEISGDRDKLLIQLSAMKRTVDNMIEFLMKKGKEA